MTAMNIVRFTVKPGFEEAFVEAHRNMQQAFKGFLGGDLVKTGDRTFCFVGQWRNFGSLANARPQMIGMLDGFRQMLEDLGSGVTDPVSGESVARLKPSQPAKKAAAKKRPAKKAAKKKAATKAKPRARAKKRA